MIQSFDKIAFVDWLSLCT